jgi:spore maturation protein CgeB
MGPFLKKAAGELHLSPRLVKFTDNLKKMETSLKGAGKNPKELKYFFELALSLVEEELKAFAPDLFLALAQAPLEPKGLLSLRSKFSETVFAFWFVEDFESFSYAMDLVPLYDHFFHIQGDYIVDKLKNLGVRSEHYLPPCADASFFKPKSVPREYRAQLSFMGAGYPNRRNIFAKLSQGYWKSTARNAEQYRIFGSGWESAPNLAPHLFEGGRRISPGETALVYAGSVVQLNIHSGHGEGFNPGSFFVNPRTFEIAAAGGFQIVDFRPLLQGLFDETELTVSNSPDSLPALIEHYLENPEEAQEKGLAARRKVLARHLYTHRLQKIIELAFPRE